MVDATMLKTYLEEMIRQDLAKAEEYRQQAQQAQTLEEAADKNGMAAFYQALAIRTETILYRFCR